MGEVQFK